MELRDNNGTIHFQTQETCFFFFFYFRIDSLYIFFFFLNRSIFTFFTFYIVLKKLLLD